MRALLALFAATLVVWQVLRGSTIAGQRTTSVSRADNPTGFWVNIGLQCAIVLVFVVMALPGDVQRPGQSSAKQQAQGAAGANPATAKGEATRDSAFAYYHDARYVDAIRVLDALLLQATNDTVLLYSRGMAHWKVAHEDLALQDFQRVRALQPDHFDATRNADWLLARQRRWDDILAMWDPFIERNPNNARAYLERGGTHLQKGERAAALADATKACELGNAEGCQQAARLK